MEKTRIEEKSVSLLKIELNKKGDYIVVSADDPTLFDRFSAGFKKIADMSDEMPRRIEEIEKKFDGKEDFSHLMEKTVQLSRENVRFSEEAIKVIDCIFGEDTVKKYFRHIYEEIPGFIPDSYCIMDFFEQVTPEMEKLFGKKIEKREKERKKRMEKYKPADHVGHISK